MRLEIHQFLWVTAGLAIIWQLSGGVVPAELVPFEQGQIRAQLVSQRQDSSEIEVKSGGGEGRAISLTYDPSVRPMFAVAALGAPERADTPSPALGPPPVLKGVLSGSDGRRAVFSRGPGEAGLVTAAAGETVADYRVQQVGEDFVTAISPAGEQVRFELRGAGEGQ